MPIHTNDINQEQTQDKDIHVKAKGVKSENHKFNSLLTKNIKYTKGQSKKNFRPDTLDLSTVNSRINNRSKSPVKVGQIYLQNRENDEKTMNNKVSPLVESALNQHSESGIYWRVILFFSGSFYTASMNPCEHKQITLFPFEFQLDRNRLQEQT